MLTEKQKRIDATVLLIDRCGFGTKHQLDVMKSKLQTANNHYFSRLDYMEENDEGDQEFSANIKCEDILQEYSSKKISANVEKMAITSGIPMPLYDLATSDYVAGSFKEHRLLVAYKFVTDILRQFDELSEVIVKRANGEVRHIADGEYSGSPDGSTYKPTGLSELEVKAIEWSLESKRRKLDEQLYDLLAVKFISYKDLRTHFQTKANEAFKGLHEVISLMTF